MDDLMGRIQDLLSDEESMKQIQELAAMFSSASAENAAPNEPAEPQEQNAEEDADAESDDGGFDMGMLFKLIQLFQSDGEGDKNSSLLMALKPHLSEEKQAKVDKAVKLMKLYTIWTVVKESGMLKNFEL